MGFQSGNLSSLNFDVDLDAVLDPDIYLTSESLSWMLFMSFS